MKRVFLDIMLIMLLLVVWTSPTGGKGLVSDSKHNLSVSGKGNIRSATETRICIFCHSSHNTSKEGPLWNHETSQPETFTTYKRSTMSSRPEQPNGSTKLCLSCHDGTIAVGAIRGLERPITMRNVGENGEIPVTRKSNIGRDLSGTHPVSVKYQQSTALEVDHLRWPPIDLEGKVGPDADGYVQCTSCHDPHDDSRSERYPFWKKATFDDVCMTCHSFQE